MRRGSRAFNTLFGLFKWLRMHFGLENAPHYYHPLIDNALYGYLKVGVDRYSIASRTSKLMDVFNEGRAKIDPRRVILGRRMYNKDKLVLAKSMTSLYGKVYQLL